MITRLGNRRGGYHWCPHICTTGSLGNGKELGPTSGGGTTNCPINGFNGGVTVRNLINGPTNGSGSGGPTLSFLEIAGRVSSMGLSWRLANVTTISHTVSSRASISSQVYLMS